MKEKGDGDYVNKPHYDWWHYVKAIIRRYPKMKGQKLSSNIALDERNAVEAAITETMRLRNGADRLKVIDLVFWKGTHKIPGAALMVPCSERTAAQWHGDFVKAVAKNFTCNGLIDESLHYQTL